jgi:hypothetical protein
MGAAAEPSPYAELAPGRAGTEGTAGVGVPEWELDGHGEGEKDAAVVAVAVAVEAEVEVEAIPRASSLMSWR